MYWQIIQDIPINPLLNPESISCSIAASQLAQTLSEMGTGSGIPDSTYAELASILLSSGRRDQALDISSEVLSVAEGVHHVLFIPWLGTERSTFGMMPEETGSRYEYVWAHGTDPAGLQGIVSEDLILHFGSVHLLFHAFLPC